MTPPFGEFTGSTHLERTRSSRAAHVVLSKARSASGVLVVN